MIKLAQEFSYQGVSNPTLLLVKAFESGTEEDLLNSIAQTNDPNIACIFLNQLSYQAYTKFSKYNFVKQKIEEIIRNNFDKLSFNNYCLIYDNPNIISNVSIQNQITFLNNAIEYINQNKSKCYLAYLIPLESAILNTSPELLIKLSEILDITYFINKLDDNKANNLLKALFLNKNIKFNKKYELLEDISLKFNITDSLNTILDNLGDRKTLRRYFTILSNCNNQEAKLLILRRAISDFDEDKYDSEYKQTYLDMFANIYDKLSVQNLLQITNNGYLLQIFIENIDLEDYDRNSLEQFILKNDDLIVWYLYYLQRNKLNIINFNEFQNKILKIKNYRTIGKFINDNRKSDINFPALKKRFNDLYVNDKSNKNYIPNINFKNPKVRPFIEYLFSIKDFYFYETYILEANFQKSPLINNIFINYYLQEKGKTYIDIYNESLKKDIKAINSIVRSFKILFSFESELSELEFYIPSIARKSTNFGGYLKVVNKICDTLPLMHNTNLTSHAAIIAIMHPSFDINNTTNQEFIEIYDHFKSETIPKTSEIDKLNNNWKKFNKTDIIDKEKFLSNFEVLKSLINKFESFEQFSFKQNTPEYISVKQLHTDVSMINNAKTLIKYIPIAQPKDPNLFKLDMELPNGISFRVLKSLDPYTLKVGVETNCCQRIGGAGEDAAIDSFINPLAGVVVVEYNGRLISQSYFHYVPEDNGIILDNVEWNISYAKELGIIENKLSKIYSVYAQMLKEKYPEINYVKCGLNYNKLNNLAFETNSMEEDPRHFEHDKQYSDFDEHRHIDLDKPKEILKDVSIDINKKTAYIKQTNILKISATRILYLKSVISNKHNLIRLANFFENKYC